MLSLIAWVLLDTDTLAGLRQRIGQRGISAHDAVAAFSRVIAGMVELIFHGRRGPAAGYLAPAGRAGARGAGQGTGGAGSAVGAQLFASGQCSADPQQRILHLIDAQERSLQVFEDFAEPSQLARWQRHQLQPHVAALERLRRALCTAKPGAALDGQLSENWFEASSERIAGLWQVEVGLAQALRRACEAQIRHRSKSCRIPRACCANCATTRRPIPTPWPVSSKKPRRSRRCRCCRAWRMDLPRRCRAAPTSPRWRRSDLLQAQSSRLARVEVELDTARRALHERKVIERAKRALMSRPA